MDNSLPHTVPCDPTSPYWVTPLDAFILGMLAAEHGLLKLDAGALQKELERQEKELENIRKSIDAQQQVLDAPRELKEKYFVEMLKDNACGCILNVESEKE